jgi:6-pyruvoyltetrahydropterin/6-carboxytetrahydropterin synthase
MIFHIFAPVFKKHDRILMGTVYLTRVEKFNAAHRLWIKEWSEEENMAYFGKCANKNWHGHNYTLYVTVKGTPDPVIGFVHDAKKLSAIIKKHVTDILDHSNLNLDVDFIPENVMPTTENMAVLIWKQLEPHIHGCRLHCVKLQETDTIYAEYYGEE